MAGAIVAVSLIASLLLVHFSLRWQPMPQARPLDVDTGLPLPEIGQASTVFSLTALFGAYLGIHLLLGLPALLGLASGTAGALLLIRRWIDTRQPKSFEDYLSQVLGGSRANAIVFALALSGVQCAFATSELVIFRDVAVASLGVRSDHATLLVVAVGIIAYFYVLLGGYMAVFRTDVLQFALVAVMGVVVLAVTAPQSPPADLVPSLVPRPGYWPLPSVAGGPPLYVYHFVIGAVMGLGFLVASPDAWKRVFLVSAARRTSATRFAMFVAVGAAPFLLLIPMGLTVAKVPDGAIDPHAMWTGVVSNDTVFVATALGLVTSFLSAFNGALLTSVHLGLMARHQVKRTEIELPRFHWLMVSALLSMFLLFTAVRTFRNPYILGNLLLGPYAIIAGVQVGGGGSVERLRDGTLLWVLVLGFLGWFTAETNRSFTKYLLGLGLMNFFRAREFVVRREMQGFTVQDHSTIIQSSKKGVLHIIPQFSFQPYWVECTGGSTRFAFAVEPGTTTLPTFHIHAGLQRFAAQLDDLRLQLSEDGCKPGCPLYGRKGEIIGRFKGFSEPGTALDCSCHEAAFDPVAIQVVDRRRKPGTPRRRRGGRGPQPEMVETVLTIPGQLVVAAPAQRRLLRLSEDRNDLERAGRIWLGDLSTSRTVRGSALKVRYERIQEFLARLAGSATGPVPFTLPTGAKAAIERIPLTIEELVEEDWGRP